MWLLTTWRGYFSQLSTATVTIARPNPQVEIVDVPPARHVVLQPLGTEFEEALAAQVGTVP